VGDDVAVPRVHLAWRGPAVNAGDEAATTLALRMLGEGKASRLYERLVYRERSAQDVEASFEDGDLGATLRIIATAKPGIAPAKLSAAILEEIARLAATPPAAEELDRAKNSYASQFLRSLQRLRARAIQIAQYDVRLGHPDGLAADLSRFRAVRPEDVSKAVAKWLDPKARVAVTIVPEKAK
jgi:predicted Zn-dependent peptidase